MTKTLFVWIVLFISGGSWSCAQETYLIDYDVAAVGGGLGSKGAGQTFTPGDAVGAEDLAVLRLVEFSLFRGSGGVADSQVSDTTFLVIYDGNPDTGTQVGASSNSVVTTIADARATKYTWTFDGLELDAVTEYWALLSNAPVDDNVLAPVGTWLQMSMETIGSTNYPGGVSVIAERNRHQTNVTDLRFKAVFEAEETVMAITAIELSEDLLQTELTWISRPGRFYAVDRSVDLQVWDELTDSVESGGTETTFGVPNPTPVVGRVYFRVRLLD